MGTEIAAGLPLWTTKEENASVSLGPVSEILVTPCRLLIPSLSLQMDLALVFSELAEAGPAFLVVAARAVAVILARNRE